MRSKNKNKPTFVKIYSLAVPFVYEYNIGKRKATSNTGVVEQKPARCTRFNIIIIITIIRTIRIIFYSGAEIRFLV